MPRVSNISGKQQDHGRDHPRDSRVRSGPDEKGLHRQQELAAPQGGDDAIKLTECLPWTSGSYCLDLLERSAQYLRPLLFLELVDLVGERSHERHARMNAQREGQASLEHAGDGEL